MSKGKSVLRYIAYIIEILVLYVINGTPNLIPEVYGGRPVILIAAAVTIAVFENEIPAMLMGILCGILLDFGTGDAVGFYAITLAIVCYVIGYINENVIEPHFLNTLIISLVAVVLVICLYFLIDYVIKGYGNNLDYFLNHIVSKLVYTYLFVPILFWLNRVFSRNLGDYYD